MHLKFECNIENLSQKHFWWVKDRVVKKNARERWKLEQLWWLYTCTSMFLSFFSGKLQLAKLYLDKHQYHWLPAHFDNDQNNFIHGKTLVMCNIYKSTPSMIKGILNLKLTCMLLQGLVWNFQQKGLWYLKKLWIRYSV